MDLFLSKNLWNRFASRVYFIGYVVSFLYKDLVSRPPHVETVEYCCYFCPVKRICCFCLLSGLILITFKLIQCKWRKHVLDNYHAECLTPGFVTFRGTSYKICFGSICYRFFSLGISFNYYVIGFSKENEDLQ